MNQALKAVAAAAASVFAGMCFAAAPNLVINGNFEGGNRDFSSSYAYSPANNSAESQYTVRSNPFPWNPYSTSVAVTANTNYSFESFVINVCCNANYTGPNSAAEWGFPVTGGDTRTETLGTMATNLGTESAVVSVPEPETHTLVLAGLCCLGVIAWRKRRPNRANA